MSNKSKYPASMIAWQIFVNADCVQRLGVSVKKIKRFVLSVLKRSPEKITYGLVNKLIYRKNGKDWQVYCIFRQSTGTIDVVDAAPCQNSDRGRMWLALIERQIEIYLLMPWRRRQLTQIHYRMFSAGVDAVEALRKRTCAFLSTLPVSSAFNREVSRVEGDIDEYHKAMNSGDTGKAIRKLDGAVYRIHEVLFEVGAQLSLL